MSKIKNATVKNHRERELSAEDIFYYGKVVTAPGETIRLMVEVDEVIESAGGVRSVLHGFKYKVSVKDRRILE